jgi:hypothetical protein
LFVNGTKVSEGRVEKTVPGVFSADETFDVGLDAASAVSADDEAPFAFTGTIKKVAIHLEELGLNAVDKDAVQKMKMNAVMARQSRGGFWKSSDFVQTRTTDNQETQKAIGFPTFCATFTSLAKLTIIPVTHFTSLVAMPRSVSSSFRSCFSSSSSLRACAGVRTSPQCVPE